MVGDKIFYLAERTVYRFTDEEGLRGGDVLVISENGGKSFSQNLFPSARHPQRRQTSRGTSKGHYGFRLSSLGVFAAQNGVFGLELTSPLLDYQNILVFRISRIWAVTGKGSEASKPPDLYQSGKSKVVRNICG